MRKKWFKWIFLGVFLCLGAYASMIAPQAVESTLPEVETLFPEKRDYREVVKGGGIIYISGKDEFMLRAAVREGDINSVRENQSAVLCGEAIGDGDYTAVVTEISPAAYRREAGGIAETVVDVILRIDNPYEFKDRLIRPGYTAEAAINVGESREILLVPYEAISQDEKGEYVLVLTGNTAIRKDIVTGAELADGTELLSGARETDELIMNPERYAENALVKPAERSD